MAFIYNQDEEKDKDGQPLTVAGTSGGTVGDDTGPGGDSPSPQKSGTSGFTDVGAYLDANKPQAMDTANKIAGQFKDQQQGLQSEIDKEGQDFESNVNSGKTSYDQSLVDRAANDPTNFVKNSDDVNKFKGMRDASYKGPETFESRDSYGKLSQRIKDAQSKAQLVDTDGGREDALFSFGNNPTKGMVTLDSLLLGQNPDARKTITDATQPFNTLSTYLDTVGGKQNANAQQAKTDTAATAKTTNDRIKAAVQSMRDGINTRLGDATNSAKTNFSTLKNDLSFGNLTENEISQLGIDPTEARSFIDNYAKLPKDSSVNFDPTAYLTDETNTITPESFASKDDYARAAALGELSGEDMGWLNDQNAQKAGTAKQNPFGFNVSGANKDLGDLLASLKQPTAPPAEPVTSTPNDTLKDTLGDKIGGTVEDTIGGDLSNIINKNVDTIGTALVPSVGLPLEVGQKVGDVISNHPIETLAPYLDPGKTFDTVKEKISNLGDTLGINTDGANPLDNSDSKAASRARDEAEHQEDAFFNSTAEQFNKLLPAKYQIDPIAISTSGNAESMIPPKGEVPDNVRDGIIFSIYHYYPFSVNALLQASPEKQADVAGAIRSNYGQANDNEKIFLAQYDKNNPQKVTTRQDVIDSIAAEKAKNKSTGKKGATFGFGKTPGVF